jgi:hypothetical protein
MSKDSTSFPEYQYSTMQDSLLSEDEMGSDPLPSSPKSSSSNWCFFCVVLFLCLICIGVPAITFTVIGVQTTALCKNHPHWKEFSMGIDVGNLKSIKITGLNSNFQIHISRNTSFMGTDAIVKWRYSSGRDYLDNFHNRTIYKNGNFFGEFEFRHKYSRFFGCPLIKIDITVPWGFITTLESLYIEVESGDIVIDHLLSDAVSVRLLNAGTITVSNSTSKYINMITRSGNLVSQKNTLFEQCSAVTAYTERGYINVDAFMEGNVFARTENGDVNIYISPEYRGSYTFQTIGGNVKLNDFPAGFLIEEETVYNIRTGHFKEVSSQNVRGISGKGNVNVFYKK